METRDVICVVVAVRGASGGGDGSAALRTRAPDSVFTSDPSQPIAAVWCGPLPLPPALPSLPPARPPSRSRPPVLTRAPPPVPRPRPRPLSRRRDVFSLEQAQMLNTWCLEHLKSLAASGNASPEFLALDRAHQGLPIANGVVLSEVDLVRLEVETGIRPMRVEQRLGDAVVVPAGCPFQVRHVGTHLRAFGYFIAPESATAVEGVRRMVQQQAVTGEGGLGGCGDAQGVARLLVQASAALLPTLRGVDSVRPPPSQPPPGRPASNLLLRRGSASGRAKGGRPVCFGMMWRVASPSPRIPLPPPVPSRRWRRAPTSSPTAATACGRPGS